MILCFPVIGLSGDKPGMDKTHTVYSSRRGEGHHAAKLTVADVRAIRASRAKGEKVTDLAARYKMTGGTISSICNRKTWWHV